MAPEIGKAGRGISWTLTRFKVGASWAIEHIQALLWQMVRGPSEGWTAFILLLLSVLLAVWVMASAQWVPLPGLYSMALCSVVLGLLLAKTRFNAWRLAIGGLLVGLALSFYQLTAVAEGASRLDRLAEVATRLFAWWEVLISGGTSTDILPFSFFLVFTSWLVGFVCSWFLFRRRNIWGALLPSSIAVVVSLTNFASIEQRFYFYLYLFVAVLLAARLFTLERQHDWEQRGIQHIRAHSWLRLPDVFWLALVVVLVTSLLPMQAARVDPIAAVWDRVSSPVRAVGEEFASVLAGVPSRKPDPGHSFGPTQPFAGGITVRGEPVLMVEAPFPIYLRARSYDVYTHQGWETGDTRLVSPEWIPMQGVDAEFQKWQQVEVNVTGLPSLTTGEPLYLGGRPIDMSIDYQLEVLEPARYLIAVEEGGADLSVEADSLPLDVRKAVQRLWESSAASSEPLTEAEITSMLPGDVWAVSWEYAAGGVEKVTVERRIPMPPDTLSVSSTNPLAAGGSYQATVLVSTASETDLRAAGIEYPGWVLDRYLQLPDAMPSRVTDLAEELTSDAETPYEKAVAIRDYLRTLDYALDIEAPPDGDDGVDYFLFELEKGYCKYFASAMTVLLRASGVPSRMAAGYGPGEMVEPHGPDEMDEFPPGEWQVPQHMFIIRESHSWSEVFFPGYGWISFESTPAYPLVIRGSLLPLPPPDAEEGGGILPGGGDDAGTPPGGGADTEAGAPWYVWAAGISLGFAVLGTIMWLGWRRLLGQVTEPRVAYARVGYLASLSRLGPSESLTPYEYGRILGAAEPDISPALDRIVDSYVGTCYGRRTLSSEDRSHIASAWPLVRNRLLRRALSGLLPGRIL